MSGRMCAAVLLFVAAAFYLTFIMPSSPAIIGGNYSPGSPSAPTAPGGNYTPPTPSAPAAPGGSYTPGSPGHPAACDDGYHVPGVVISGNLTPNPPREVPMRGIISGKPWCATLDSFDGPEDSEHLRVSYGGGRWIIVYYPTGTTGPGCSWRAAPGNEATPDLAGGWAPDPGSDLDNTGVPVLRWIAPPVAPIAPAGNYTPATPSSPAAPGSNYSAPTPSAPAAPGGSYTPPTPGNPPAASGSYTPPTPSAPAAPGSSYTPPTPSNPPTIGTDYSPS